MLRLFNAFLVLTALVSAFVLYSLEHQMRATERQIAHIKSEIAEEREAIKLLGAEWSNLTQPARLQAPRGEPARAQAAQGRSDRQCRRAHRAHPERPRHQA